MKEFQMHESTGADELARSRAGTQRPQGRQKLKGSHFSCAATSRARATTGGAPPVYLSIVGPRLIFSTSSSGPDHSPPPRRKSPRARPHQTLPYHPFAALVSTEVCSGANRHRTITDAADDDGAASTGAAPSLPIISQHIPIRYIADLYPELQTFRPCRRASPGAASPAQQVGAAFGG